MIKLKRLTIKVGCVCLLASVLGGITFSVSAKDAVDSTIKEGKQIAMNKTKGNCVACHAMDDGELPGTIAPPLIAMKLRFPDKKILRAQIVDPRIKNPSSIMPPFGAYEILTEEEIDKLVEYLHTL